MALRRQIFCTPNRSDASFRRPYGPRPRSLAAFVLLVLAGCTPDPGADVENPSIYSGTLDWTLEPWIDVLSSAPLKALSPRESAQLRLSDALDNKRVLGAAIRLDRGAPIPTFVLEPLLGPCEVLLDLNRNNTIDPDERFSLLPSGRVVNTTAGEILLRAESTLQLPLQGGRLSTFPILVRYGTASRASSEQPLPPLLQWSNSVTMGGSVDIGETPLTVRVGGLTVDSPTVDPRNGMMGLDTNRDGTVDTRLISPEWAAARGENVVFRSGDRYFSFAQVDLASGEIRLREHPQSDYIRIELSVGSALPDFEFVDFDGQARRLSEFRGKFLLLDFWGSWCGPCLREFPYLVPIWQRFRERGFDVLGINADPSPADLRVGVSPTELEEGLAKAREVVERFQANWTHARTASVTDLIQKRFRVTSFPTAILLDRELRVVLADRDSQGRLRGEQLAKTLDELLEEN